MINKLNWSEVIFFFDVDDTLVDTGSNSIIASEGIFNVLKQELGEDKSNKIKNRFNQIFQTLMQEHMTTGESNKKLHDSIMLRINQLQEPVIKQYGMIKKWSREVFLKMASEDCDIQLKPEIIYSAIDAYWNIISEKSDPMPGVLDLFQEIKAHSSPVYLITSSDARLKINNQGLFEYDSRYSEEFKKKRMETLKQKGLFFNKVSIGDPEDKPHLDFFEKGIRIAEKDLGYKINTKNIIMFGDSYAGDLQTPKEKLGFGLVVLFKKDQGQTIEESERYISTGNISSVTDYLK
ncbi:MAG: HAD family hydrolase [Candidatus Roizmanbacteria bacterium]